MPDRDELTAETDEQPAAVGRRQPLKPISLRELVSRAPDERDRVVRSSEIVIDADEVAAWDATAADGLEG